MHDSSPHATRHAFEHLSAPTAFDVLERAAFSAWPALEDDPREGWALRWAQGYTKRANSANPLGSAARPLTADLIEEIQAWYTARDLPTIFRLPEMAPHGADAILSQQGYAKVDPSLVLWRELSRLDPDLQASPPSTASSRHQVVWSTDAASWLADFQAVAGSFKGADAAAQHLRLLQAIQHRCAWGVLHAEGRPVACALGVLSPDGVVGLFDVATLPNHQRRGAARQLCLAVLRWAAEQGGAHTAYLQVVAANAPARALYASLGFTQAYGYHYRVKPRPVD
jgi:N-acetylglutamate synthase